MRTSCDGRDGMDGRRMKPMQTVTARRAGRGPPRPGAHRVRSSRPVLSTPTLTRARSQETPMFPTPRSNRPAGWLGPATVVVFAAGTVWRWLHITQFHDPRRYVYSD